MRGPASLFFFFTATLCAAQAPAPLFAPADTTTYHSDAMNLDFVYPSSFVSKSTTGGAPTRAQDNATGNKKAANGCVTFPIGAMDMRDGFNMIFLRRSDEACLAKETTATERGTAAVNLLTDLLRQLGKPTMSSSTNYDLGSHTASMVSGSVKPDARGTVIYGTASCVVTGRNLACFAFLSSDCRTLAVLSASTVKFADTGAMPVIPAKLAPACKL